MRVSGRNEPCPCGSGRKYKLCCGGAQRPARITPHPFHAADQRAVEAMLTFARKALATDRLSAAFESWGLDLDSPELQLAMQLAFHVRSEAGRTIAERFAAESPKARHHATVLESQRASWLSIWEVLAARPGEGLDLRDLITGEERTVHELSASQSLVARDAILTRIVRFEGADLLAGMYPRSLPPRHATLAVASLVRDAGATARPTPESLRGESMTRALLAAWRDSLEMLDRRPAPELRNTDGDPMLMTTDRFSFDPARRDEVRRLLAKVEGMDLDGDSGALTRPGNPMHRGWDNTVLAHVEILFDRFTVSTNSIRRADELRTQLETACAGLVGHHSREHSDPSSPAFRKSVKAGRDESPDIPPEDAARIVLEWKAAHYDRWPDEPLPALDGKTPRQAVRGAKGRLEVEILLKEMEHGEAVQPAQFRYDFRRMRAELGLPA